MRAPSVPAALVAAAERMRGFPAPWCVAGGWALDLFLGRVTRPHGDVDLAIFRDDQAHLRRHLAGWSFRTVVGGRFTEWADGEWLSLPVHEIHAAAHDDPASTLELLLNECVGDDWAYRRDPRIRCPVGDAILPTGAGLPVLCPAVVLLYKAKAPREADERDFEAVRGSLGSEKRAWLRGALETAHPDHPWLLRL